MSEVICKKFLDVTKVQIKYFLWVNILLSIALVIATPLLFGVKNLDSIASSFVLERFVALIGIVLFTPLFSPETDKNISELVESKNTSPTFVYLSRLLVSILVLVTLIAISIITMWLGACEFNVIRFGFGTLSTALFLGSLGFVTFAISSNVVVGYMLPIAIYMLNLFQGEKLKMLYLFSLSKNDLNEKYWLLGCAMILFLIGVLYKYCIRKLR